MEGIKAFLSVDSGSGDGSGSGSGYGYGYGSGYGSGYGYGYGYGYGSGSGIKMLCHEAVHELDGVATLINLVRGNVAKGRILQSDLTTTPCYVVKQDGIFAHGRTLREAQSALLDKLFEDMPADERIKAFCECHDAKKLYPNADYFDWHHKLTGSCKAGREAFARDHGIDMAASMSVSEFIDLTKNAYGGGIIKQLAKQYAVSGERRNV